MTTSDDTAKLKQCTKCKQFFQPTTEYFWKDAHLKDGLMSSCKLCNRKRENLPLGQKRCPKCLEVFPATTEYFGNNRAENDGLTSRCIVCHREQSQEWRLSNNVKLQRVDLPDTLRLCGVCKHAYPATREYFSPNKNGKDGLQSQCKQCCAILQRRRARTSEGEDGYTAADIKQLYRLQKGLCWWCEKPLNDHYHIDHRIPLSKNGSNRLDNIVLAHAYCNLSKGDKLPGEWIVRLL